VKKRDRDSRECERRMCWGREAVKGVQDRFISGRRMNKEVEAGGKSKRNETHPGGKKKKKRWGKKKTVPWDKNLL